MHTVVVVADVVVSDVVVVVVAVDFADIEVVKVVFEVVLVAVDVLVDVRTPHSRSEVGVGGLTSNPPAMHSVVKKQTLSDVAVGMRN